jgi:phenylpyruvate tautomerase PptA (4-oxalocrotonate tautomerase family)
MPQVLIHVSNVLEEGQKAALISNVREAISIVLKLDKIIGQVILYESPVSHRCSFADRDPHFVFIETFMYPGRDPALKTELMERIIHLVTQYTSVDNKNIHAVIHEIPKENYFGGMMKRH